MGPDASISGCSDPGSVLTYSSEPDDWYEITNWSKGEFFIYWVPNHFCLEKTSTLDSPVSDFSLDEENVPCQSDSVRFPSSSTFMVRTNIQTNAVLDYMSIWGSALKDDQAFDEYLETSKSGKYQFSNFESTWTNQDCDGTGCPCRPKERVFDKSFWLGHNFDNLSQ